MENIVLVPLFVLAVAALVLGGMNLYQAVTGKRLSTRASTRTDEVMRRQSAVAAFVLILLGLLSIFLGVALASS